MPSTEDPNSTKSVDITQDTDTPGQATMATHNGIHDQPNTHSTVPTNDVTTAPDTKPLDPTPEDTKPVDSMPKEYGGPAGLEPTRYGDWEKNGRCSDF